MTRNLAILGPKMLNYIFWSILKIKDKILNIKDKRVYQFFLLKLYVPLLIIINDELMWFVVYSL